MLRRLEFDPSSLYIYSSVWPNLRIGFVNELFFSSWDRMKEEAKRSRIGLVDGHLAHPHSTQPSTSPAPSGKVSGLSKVYRQFPRVVSSRVKIVGVDFL